MNTIIQGFFARHPMAGIVAIVILLCCLCLTIAWYLNFFSTPSEQTKTIDVLNYSESGSFGYEAELNNNLLYGPVTLTEHDSSVIHLNIVKRINGSFSYEFTADQPVEDVNHQVQITALLENPNNWSKSIPVVSQIEKTDDFTLSFPIEADYLLDVAQAINEELGIMNSLYNLTIRASVNTSASSEYGPINEVFVLSIRSTLQPGRIAWSGDYPFHDTRQGDIQETVTFQPEKQPVNPYRLIAPVFIAVAIVYLSWNYYRSRNMIFSPMLEDSRRIKVKYKDAVADITALSDEAPKDTSARNSSTGKIVTVSSLDELVKISVILLKPVLRKMEPDRHVYYVIDGETKYMYISEDFLYAINQQATDLESPIE